MQTRLPLTLAVLLTLPLFFVVDGADVVEFRVGIWYPTTTDGVLSMYQPLFEDYLNRVVGSSLNIRFKAVVVDLEESTLAERLIEANQLDFFFSVAGRIACVERAFDWILLATGRNSVLGAEVGAQSAIIYSLKTNTAILNVSDFKSKRIGVALIYSPSFFMGQKVLADHGIDLYKDTKQLVFYGNAYGDQLQDVLKENIDVGITSGTFLFQKYPDQIPYLNFHNLLNLTWESVPFPFPTSAPLAPTYTLACSPDIPYAVKRAVEAALMNLDVNSPAAKAAGLSNFTTAGSLFNTRAAMEAANLFDANGRCVSPFANMRAIMSCPKGTVVDSNNGLKKRCQDNHLTCPTGYPCFCGMCVANKYATIYPGEVVLGLSTALFGLNLAVIVFWGFGLEVAACVRRPVRRLAKKLQDAFRRRAVPHTRKTKTLE